MIPSYRDTLLSGAHDLGLGISIAPAGFWPFDTTVLRSLGEILGREVTDSTLWLAAEYEADSMGEPTEEPGVTKQGRATRRLREAQLALWIVRPTPLSFRVAIHQFERGGETLFQSYEIAAGYVVPLERYRAARVIAADIAEARTLLSTIASLQHEGPVWIACRSAFNAIQDFDPGVRVLLLWIALEALFGAADRRRGIGGVVSKRAGKFLEIPEDSREGRRAISRKLSASYDHRNTVIHGMRGRTLPSPEDLLLSPEGAVRSALRRVLSEPGLVATFNDTGREAYLDALL